MAWRPADRTVSKRRPFWTRIRRALPAEVSQRPSEAKTKVAVSRPGAAGSYNDGWQRGSNGHENRKGAEPSFQIPPAAPAICRMHRKIRD